MNREQSHKVKEWLGAFDRIDSLRAVTVTIGRQTYQGAEYIDRSNGDTRPRLYLCGGLPSAYRRSARTCFKISGDSRDWYVACYMTEDRLTDQFKPYHPFGANFLLMPWETPQGDTIDKYESAPRKRIDARVEYLDAPSLKA